jgi:uncharacterized protein YecE (DUF72 family)
MKLWLNNWYCGTSGLVLPVPNKLAYPEEYRERSRLFYYSTLFNSLEVNSSFYKLPMKRTVERWSTDVAGNFKFTYKLSKEITHCRDLLFDVGAVKNFFDVVKVPDEKRGCLLIQFPGKISFDYHEHLVKMLKLVTRSTVKQPWSIAVEFRHESWYNEKTRALLTKYEAAVVIHDIKPFTKEYFDTGSRLVYIRFHGPEKNYRGSYTDEYLGSYARKIRSFLKNGKVVYAYFNNTLGPAALNLQTLDTMVRK